MAAERSLLAPLGWLRDPDGPVNNVLRHNNELGGHGRRGHAADAGVPPVPRFPLHPVS